MNHQYITDKSGVAVSVIIPIDEWEQIQAILQQKLDTRDLKNPKADILAVIEKYKSIKPFKTISDPIEWQKEIRDEW